MDLKTAALQTDFWVLIIRTYWSCKRWVLKIALQMTEFNSKIPFSRGNYECSIVPYNYYLQEMWNHGSHRV